MHDDGAKAAASGKTTVKERIFDALGDQRYRLKLLPVGIVIEADRVRRHSHELWGEVTVTVNGHLPHAKKVFGDILHAGDMNFSSVQARGSRAKILEQRSGADWLDWGGFVEELAYRIQAHERQGRPAVDLADGEVDVEEQPHVVDVRGFPLFLTHPTILFGDGAAGKSSFSLWLAGTLVGMGLRVMYLDWELEIDEHRRTFRKMFQPPPRGLLHLRCDRPIAFEQERIQRAITDNRVSYLVADSVGYACNHRPEDAENANEYFRVLRSFRLGSLNLAHVTKREGETPDKPFGSTFWHNGARATWYIQRADQNPAGELRFGLYNKKNNLGERLAPRAYALKYRTNAIAIEQTVLSDIEELTAGLPLLERMKRYLLKNGAATVKDLADELGSTQPVVRMTVVRHPASFIRLGKKVGVKDERQFEF